ncbi:uncharacterized protein [Littorina saxatilis]|uniref:uncharacterized protein n=1 Tax=Littorina saxatilis TaxID=31220 RepID=UPI0038B68FD0
MEIDCDDDEPLITIANAFVREETPPEQERLNETWEETDDEPLISIIRSAKIQAPRIDISSSSEDVIELPSTFPPRRNKRKRNNQLDRTIASSTAAARTQERVYKEHESKLNNIFAANGFYKVNVPSDGNCFFDSASRHLDGMDPLALRAYLCDHMENSFAAYLDFLSCEEDDNERYLSYFYNVGQLRNPGTWCNDAADLIPMALADWSGRQVKIFTSDPYKPVLVVVPGDSDGDLAPITLSLLQVEAAHYEPVFEIPRPVIGGRVTPVPRELPQVESPRQQGPFYTPPTKQLHRERTAIPTGWKKNCRKRLRLEGKEYTSESGNIKRAKSVQHVNCQNCRFGCNKITSEERQNIFQAFYALTSYERQKDFICSNVQEQSTRTVCDEGEPVPKKRQVCRSFSFSVDGHKERVCKKMFLATLDIGDAFVDHALRHSQHGSFTGRERRGRHQPHNKSQENEVERARKHIESLPVVESHYTRKDSIRKYLAANLNITKMYQLHKTESQKEGVDCVSTRAYRSIFNKNYNLSFHVPKKDQCAKCTLYSTKAKSGTITEEEQELFNEHMQKKEEAKKEKERDKERAKKDPSLHVITVDMQAVLQTPCGAVSQLYYKRKLSVFNFTTYSLADGKATCYTWDETEAKRGACEIATCLLMYIASLSSHVKDVILYSDCCGGQNRNQYFATCFMHAVNTIPNINSITHKYLEPGHTQLECDSMHSAITCVKKNTPIFTPSGWNIVFRQARRQKPYMVMPLKHKDVLDFKQVAHSRVRNTKTDIQGHKVKWLNIRTLQFRKGMDDLMFFKYSHTHEDYRTLRLVGSAKRGRPDLTKPLPRLYSNTLLISGAKKRDLLSLCASEIIPSEHHAFYEALAVSTSAKDKLAEPDANEPDQDTD